MSRINNAIEELERLENTARRDIWINRLHPGVKVFLTILFAVLTVSFPSTDVPGLLTMGIYPAFMMITGDISARKALGRLKPVLPVILLIGILNPLFDRETAFLLGNLRITSGMLSMAGLMFKGIWCVLAGYILICSTTIGQICATLRRIGFPKPLVTVIMLMYRYIFLLMSEADRTVTAYSLRAPGQKGIRMNAWGSLAGNLLLRSIDKAQTLYQSMLLQGFRGEYPLSGGGNPSRFSIVFGLVCSALLLLLRFVPVAELAGGILC